MRRVLGLVGVAVVGLVGVALVAPGDDGPVVTTGPDNGGVRAATATGLEAFDACDTLVDHLRTVVAAHPWDGGVAVGGMVDDVGMEEATAETRAAAGDGDQGASGTSDTNTQVAGVDELDLTETDGRRVYTVLDGRLHVVDLTGRDPVELADVALDLPNGGDGEMLLHDGRLLVVVRGWSDVRPGVPEARGMLRPMGSSVTSLVLFDVTGERPVEVARTDLEGELVAGRAVDGTAHLVVAHRPQPLPMAAMEGVWSAPDEDAARREMTSALATSTAADWLPTFRHVDARGVVTSGPSVDCLHVLRPVDSEDTSMLEVVTLDLHGGDALPEGVTAVLTDARAVTATATEMVVATPVWNTGDVPIGGPAVDVMVDAPGQVATRLHLFDLGPRGATHRASGEVPGQLLNQFSMSLDGDLLRVATTAFSNTGDTESGVVVLRPAADRLDVVGQVGGLGRGETIQSVRFLGDRAYVVTFRQTDPLYTIDLSDPTDPQVTGELKITGYSAYLHPLAGERLLGIGQEATLEGATTGTQVSVFDVSDPAAPSRISQVQVPDSSSEAEWDHHAVLVHDGLVVVPFERWGIDRGGGYETGALVLALDGDRVTLTGTIASAREGDGAGDPWQRAVRRAMVVDGQLVTVSRANVTVFDPATLVVEGQVAL